MYVYEWEAKSSLASSLFPGAHVFGTYTVSPWRIHLFKVEGASSALRNYSCWFNIPDLSPHQVNKQCMLHGFYLLVTVAPPSVVVIPKGIKLKSSNALARDSHSQDTMPTRTAVSTPNAPAPLPFFSQAIVCNGMVYCSGSIGINPDSQAIVEGGVGDRTVSVRLSRPPNLPGPSCVSFYILKEISTIT